MRHVPKHIITKRIAELGQPPKETTLQAQKKRIFVVVRIEKQDAYYANQPLRTPVAAFIHEANASKFVARKQSEEWLHLDWEIVPLPVEDTT